MKISNATVTSKQNFIEKYDRLMKNHYNQNCSRKNEGNITVSEITKIQSLHGFFLLQPTVDLSTFEQNLQEARQTLHQSQQRMCTMSLYHYLFLLLINFWLFIVFNFNTGSFI